MPGARNRADSTSRAVEEESFNLGFIITRYPFYKSSPTLLYDRGRPAKRVKAAKEGG
jgi:hypothetical protein